jgi:hypothetical protein
MQETGVKVASGDHPWVVRSTNPGTGFYEWET